MDMDTLILEWPLKLEPPSPAASSGDECFLELLWPGDGVVDIDDDPNQELHLPWEMTNDDSLVKEEKKDVIISCFDADDAVASPPPTRGEMASKMLEDLDSWIKEEPFTVWLEEKMELPLLADLTPSPPAPEVTAVVPAPPPPPPSTNNTQTLLQEFQTVFEQVSTCHDTPPQSPETVDAELAAVEALVRDRAERLVSAPVEHHPPPVPEAPQVLTTTNLLPASPSSASSDEGSDPDWQPSPIPSSSSKAPPAGRRGRAPRSRPYAAADERRQRKKEQNKNAATRYRQKKKAEVEEILSEERVLEKHNTKLREQLNEIGREVKYLKGLMRDLCRAKGLIN